MRSGSPSKQRYTAPAITTFHNILAALPPETLDNAIGQWTGRTAGLVKFAHHALGFGIFGVRRLAEPDQRLVVVARHAGAVLVQHTDAEVRRQVVAVGGFGIQPHGLLGILLDTVAERRSAESGGSHDVVKPSWENDPNHRAGRAGNGPRDGHA